MQRAWPGSPKGNDTERLAHALDQSIVRHCSHMVDMHCWQRVTAAEAITPNDHEPSAIMTQVTTTRFFSNSLGGPIPKSGPMRADQLMRKYDGCSIAMELSGQFEMPERQVLIGLSSMVNIAKRLGLIEGEPERIAGPRVLRSKETCHEVRAPCAGLFVGATRGDQSASLAPEDYVEKGQSLGHIIRENDLVSVPIVAPVRGYLWRYGVCHWDLCDASLPAQHPYANAGENLAVVATV